MKDISDALDSYLRSKSIVGAWTKEFMVKWYKPLIEMTIQQSIDGIKMNPNVDQQALKNSLSPQGQARLEGK